MEQDAIERFRRDLECKQYADYQLEQVRLKRDEERKLLIEETKRFRSIWEEDNRKEEEGMFKIYPLTTYLAIETVDIRVNTC